MSLILIQKHSYNLHAAVIGGRLSALTYLIKWLLERDRIISEDNDEKRSLKNFKKFRRDNDNNIYLNCEKRTRRNK